MLADERTTQGIQLSLPSEVEGLVVAPGRAMTRVLVAFLRGRGINVRTLADGDAAFEEALLHPPDIVLIDDRIRPSGGVDLCRRLKENVRTHFVPLILLPLNDLRHTRLRAFEAGADAVFAPSMDEQEREARLWALLRTRALYRRLDRKQRTQSSEIVDRRQWLSQFLHDFKGQVAALSANVDFLGKFGPPPGDPQRADFDESLEDARGIFEQLKANARTVLDYERFESGQLALNETRFFLSEAAAEVIESLRRYAAMAEKSLSYTGMRAGQEPAVYGDRELISSAMLNLGMAALRRTPTRVGVGIDISETAGGLRFRVAVPGAPLQAAERLHMFEPSHGPGATGYGLGLAVARAIVEAHDGRIWVEDLPRVEGVGAPAAESFAAAASAAREGGCLFVFELGWKAGPRAKRSRPRWGVNA